MHAAAFNAGRVLTLDQGVKIGQEEETLYIRVAAVLNRRADGADVIANVQSAGCINTGEDAFFFFSSFSFESRSKLMNGRRFHCGADARCMEYRRKKRRAAVEVLTSAAALLVGYSEIRKDPLQHAG